MSSLVKWPLIKGFKTFSFLVLLIIVTWQYALEIYGKFVNDSKTFVSKTVDADSFIIPPLTICMDNALKVPPCLYKKNTIKLPCQIYLHFMVRNFWRSYLLVLFMFKNLNCTFFFLEILLMIKSTGKSDQ